MEMKILKFSFLLLICVLTNCMEKVDIEIPADYDNANITGINIYRASKEGDSEYTKNDPIKLLTSTVQIDSETNTVKATLGTTEDITQLKITLTTSSGATILNPIGSEIQDFSTPYVVEIASPSKKVIKQWTISILL